jgi:hypothetical protein
MPAQQQNQRERTINIFSLNTARKNDVAHHALHIASTHKRRFDIMLHQEPWYGPISDHEVGEARGNGWTVLTPVVRTPEVVRRPRVMAYVRQNTDLEIVQRTDLIEDYDLQILDIKRQGTLQRTVRVINIYNVPEGGENFAVDRLCQLQLDPTIPTIITGDWNLKHNLYRAMPEDQNPNERAVRTADWLSTNGFDLQNQWNQETWRKYGETQTSALDFTFKNDACEAANILQNWTIEPNSNAGSDHYATFFSLGGGEEEIVNLTEAKYNWKGMDAERFTKSLDRELHLNQDTYNDTFGPLGNATQPPTREDIDNATQFLLNGMSKAAEEAVPRRRPSPRAKAWWTPKLSQARDNLNKARSDASAIHKTLGLPDPEAVQRVKHYAAVADRLYKKTKREFYAEVIRSTGPQNFWDLKKWTQGSRQYPSPPINRGEGLDPALSHSEKCDVLRNKLLPAPHPLPNPPIYDLDPHPEDLEWNAITRNEVRTAILGAKAHNAPGISGMTGAAYRQAWKVASEEIFLILHAAAEAGYHPEMFRNSICVVLRKPKKPDYTLPKAYRPIQLLEVLGKALERIQGARLSYLATKHDMIPPLHFGGIKGKSAEDAILCATHDIQAAHNHNLVTSSLTFDIAGFFNNISHPTLIATLREKRIPLPMVKWVESFLSDRQTAMCLDGTRGDLRPTTTGVPQGSPVSPPLSGFYTATLTDKLNQEMASTRLGPDLEERARRAKATRTNLILYVDDGKLSVASESIATNVILLARAHRVVEQWLTDHGLNSDPDKRELIHHSWRNTDQKSINDQPPAIDTPVTIQRPRNQQPERIAPTRSMKWLGVIFDTKLTFQKHVKSSSARATHAINSLSMLGNSVRGLHQVYR